MLDSDRSLCLMATGGRRASAPVTLRRTRIWLIMLDFVDTHQGGRVDGEKLFGPIARDCNYVFSRDLILKEVPELNGFVRIIVGSVCCKQF